MRYIIWSFLLVINCQEDEPIPQIFQVRSNIEIDAIGWKFDEIPVEDVNAEIEDLFCKSGRISFPGADECIRKESGK